MTKEKLFEQIANIFVGFGSIEDGTHEWFIVRVRGCVFPAEIARLRELCYVSMISFDLCNICLEVHCKYMSDYECK